MRGSTSIINRRNRLIFFLARGVPDLESNTLAIAVVMKFGEEGGSEGGLIIFIELVVDETKQ